MIRDVLDSFPLTPLFVAGFTSFLWAPTLRAYSEILQAITFTLLTILAVYKAWQAYRDHSKRPDAMRATASAAGAAAKLRFGGVGLLIAGIITLAIGAVYLFKKRQDAPAVIAAAAAAPAAKRKKRTADDAGEDGTEVAPVDRNGPKWYQLAHAEIGVAEIPGKKHNARVLQYYADAGNPGVKDDETAWCAAFVGAMLERADVPCSKSLMASSYDKWGEDASASPQVGDVVRLWRDSPKSIWGHVGFYAGETKTHVLLLGGNQSNAVNVAKFPKSRIVSIRRPRSILKSRTAASGVASAVTGVTTISTATVTLVNVLDEAGPAVDTLNKAGDKISTPLTNTGQLNLVKLGLCIMIGCAALTVLFGAYTAWRRAQDKKERGH
jgi:uncharacterized protein (TIGR02594 family)